MKIPSINNVIIPLSRNESTSPTHFVLMNILAGSLDLVDETVAKAISRNGKIATTWKHESSYVPPGQKISKLKDLPEDVLNYFDRRGYLFNSAQEEQEHSRLVYQEMLRFHRDVVRQPIVIIPTYKCNLECPYCWQRLYNLDSPVISEEMIHRIFEVLPKHIQVSDPSRVDLVVYGGEPLQPDAGLPERVSLILKLARERGYKSKILSNGIYLASAIDSLKGKVDLIQITLDGPEHIHSKRRLLPNGGDSFTPTVQGITKAVEAGISINVRVNVNNTTLESLPELADYVLRQGWLESGLVRMHIAPIKNHDPNKKSQSESQLLSKVLKMVELDDRMKIYDINGFSGIKYFAGFKESGMFPLHRFFNCEAQINLFVYDLIGDIYACWDAAGLPHLRVGKLNPQLEMEEAKLADWRERTSLEMQACGKCTLSPHCGGGCQFMSLEHGSSYSAPSCDSMAQGYIQSIQGNADWLIERAMAGDHYLGMVSAAGIITTANDPLKHKGAEVELESASINCE